MSILQRQVEEVSQLLKISCPLFAALSGLVKIAMTVMGTFLAASFHLGVLYVLFLDYMGIATWY